MMFVHRSNRLEHLVDMLADVVRVPLRDPIRKEVVVVGGRGIERWLTRALGDRLGVWANAAFPFPRAFLTGLFDEVSGSATEADAGDDPDLLTWSIAAALPRLIERDEFAPVRLYLDRQSGSAPLLALARRIARTLDRYAVYRPDWITRWESVGDHDWQAILWREIHLGKPSRHPAARTREFVERLPFADPQHLPERVCLFGLSSLAPLYLEAFVALADRIDVHLFVQNPSWHYWGDIRARREVLREVRRRNWQVDDIEAEIIEAAGNPLLAALGGLGRDFQALLEGSVDYRDAERYEDPGHSSMLHALQSDILELIDRRGDEEKLSPGDADDSLRIHVCHSPIRELQVLHESLRDLFERDATLQPHDVVVLCPSIDEYAPLIEAVFGATEGSEADDPLASPSRAIPFRIADRRIRTSDELVDAFLQLLTVVAGRMTASEIVDLVDLRPIRERFDIAEADVETITTWIRDAAIRWGVDAEHRRESGQPPFVEHTWRFGLERLFLGFAMEPDARHAVAGRMPAVSVESTPSALLGSFADFCTALFRWRSETRNPDTVDAWRDKLLRMLDEMTSEDRAQHGQQRAIRDALSAFATDAERAGFRDPIDLTTIRVLLEEKLERASPGRNFLSGSVTFCAMVPMRSVPFQVVCLLGMNDDAFPRRERRAGFDRMQGTRRLGDRSVRDDDHYLFLEAILAARRNLIVTYVGRSARDNKPLPPATPVNELVDVLSATFGNAAVRAITIEHPLQPFSRRYFDGSDPRLRSFETESLAGARALRTPPDQRQDFRLVRGPLPRTADDDVDEIALDSLVRFFRNPAKAFLQERLGLFPGDESEGIDDREPLVLDGLARWRVGDAIVAGHSDDTDAFRAAGELPPGNLGSVAIERVRVSAHKVLDEGARWRSSEPVEPIAFDISVGDDRVTGTLDGLWPVGQVRVHYARQSAGQLLDLWIRHLVLSHVRPEACAARSTLVARDGKDEVVVIRIATVEDPLPILEDLLRLRRQGRIVPLPLFPVSSMVYCEKRNSHSEEDALAAARKSFASSSFHAGGDAADTAIASVFGVDPDAVIRAEAPFPLAPDLDFITVARRVFDPLLAHLDTSADEA